MSSNPKHLSVSHGAGSGRLSRSPSTSSAHGERDAGSTKPKITKSRNGCITCKAKRLKCDETKPTCLQCKKRNVECGGYKKNFKWKSFDESSFTGEGSTKARDMPSAESGPSPPSPVPDTPSSSASPTQSRYSQPFQLTDPTSISQASTFSLPVPQRPRGHSHSSQGSYHEQPSGFDHLQVPGYFADGPSNIPPASHRTPGAYTAYPPRPTSDMSLETMMAQELHSPLSTAGYFPETSGSGYGQMGPHGTPSAQMGYPYTQSLDVGMSQASMMIPVSGAHIDAHGQWQMAPADSLGLDEQAIQQAMAELEQQQANYTGVPTSRSYNG